MVRPARWAALVPPGLLLVGVATLLVFAYLTGVRPAYVLGYAFGLLLVTAWAWPRIAVRGLRIERTLDSGRPVVGETFHETFTVSKRGWLPAPWVEIADLGNLPGYQPGRVVSMGQAAARWSAHGVYRRRGWAEFGPLRLQVMDVFGLFTAERVLGPANRVLVYPRVHSLPTLVMPSGQRGGESRHTGSWTEHPPDAGGVREYTAGDSYSRIHWPLSQRYQQLMSKTFEQPLTADLWLVLDLDRTVHTLGSPAEDASTVEYAVSLAASIAVQVRERGRQVGLIANDASRTLLVPGRTVQPERLILDFLALADADTSQHLASSDVWPRLRGLPRRAVAVVTPSPDPGWVRALEAVRKRSGRLIAFYIDGASFGADGGSLPVEPANQVDLYVVRRGEDPARISAPRPGGGKVGGY